MKLNNSDLIHSVDSVKLLIQHENMNSIQNEQSLTFDDYWMFSTVFQIPNDDIGINATSCNKTTVW